MSVKAKVITLAALFCVCVGLIVFGMVTGGGSLREHLPRLIIMGITLVLVIIRIVPSRPKKKPIDPAEIRHDIAAAKEWIVTALTSSGYQADFSMDSLKEIDRFFDEQSPPNGILAENVGQILFGIGVYVGETILANAGGEWDLEQCVDEMTIAVKIEENKRIFPIIRVMARYEHGSKNSIYAYGKLITKE